MQEIPVYEGNYDLYQKATFLQSLRNTIHIRFNDTMIQNEAVMFLLWNEIYKIMHYTNRRNVLSNRFHIESADASI